MQLNLQQLPSHLKGSLLPIYLVSGEETLLLQEAQDAIRQAANRAGYDLRLRLEAGNDFDWNELIRVANSYQLFANQTFIELHNPAGQFDSEAGKTLVQYSETAPSDKILLIITGKLTAAQQKTTWYKNICEKGAAIVVWPLKAHELPQWIKTRLQQAGIKADSAAIGLLAELTTGNLLATQQAIIKLQLLYPNAEIGVKEMMAAVSDSARFNVFELSQYLLQGDAHQVIRVLRHLQCNGTEPTLILWLLAKECREILNMHEPAYPGSHWASLKSLYQTAMRRIKPQDLKKLLLQCHETDQILKGAITGNVWNNLTHISLALAGTKNVLET
ncbi:MAG: DNA polymerase III subunit delta [Proteobacteria bacterium]|nr:DNA polymerase III subunit delta [Pseudomonadota bacterium]